MAETMDLIKIGIAGVVGIIVALVIMGFYFTVTSASGQGFLVGGFETFAESVFQFISSPFVALYNMITNIPKLLGLWILGFAFVRKPVFRWTRRGLKVIY